MGFGDKLKGILARRPQRPKTDHERLLKHHLEEVTGWHNEFEYHNTRIETLEHAINSITVSRNLVDTAVRELRVEEYRKMKDGFEGTFDERTEFLHFRLANVRSRQAREVLTVDVADTLVAALVAAGSSDLPPHLLQRSHFIEPWQTESMTDGSSILTSATTLGYNLPDDIRDILEDRGDAPLIQDGHAPFVTRIGH